MKRKIELWKGFRFAGLFCVIAIGLATIVATGKNEAPLKRETKYGTVRGIKSAYNTLVWKGIPYAKPPVGELRWKAPVEPNSWSGVWRADRFCIPCVQYSNSSTYPENPANTLVGLEDCLYLNIWRPNSTKKDLPVFFWIHGGGNSGVGAGSEPQFDGAKFAGKLEVVFVTINYRLGPMGWLTHPALENGENTMDDSGNYGSLDLIRALEWVRDNIDEFDGDPENVTIAGESDGAINVFSLMLIREAEGLFHRAIAQSESLKTDSPEEGKAEVEKLILDLLKTEEGIENPEEYRAEMTPDEVAAYLRSKTAFDILGQYTPGIQGMLLTGFSSVFEDGELIPENAYETFKAGNYYKVPTIIGNNTEEAKAFIPFMKPVGIYTDYEFFELISDMDGEKPDLNVADVISISEEAYELLGRYLSLRLKAVDVHDIAAIMSEHQPGEIYAYEFAWNEQVPPFDVLFGACHSLEIPFVFGNFNKPSPWSKMWTASNKDNRETLSKTMMSYWAEFARTGETDVSGLRIWDSWSNVESESKYIVFDSDSEYSMVEERLYVEDIRNALQADPAFIALEPLNQAFVLGYYDYAALY